MHVTNFIMIFGIRLNGWIATDIIFNVETLESSYLYNHIESNINRSFELDEEVKHLSRLIPHRANNV